MENTPSFRLNGHVVPLGGADPRQSLLRWLQQRRLTGTKEGCGDGDCGACTVALVDLGVDGQSHFQAINSCLLPMGSLPDREITTVEALADGDALHPAQQLMVECAGSQCGYCTPGFVMSLFVGSHEGELGDSAIEGNLCRCTGYRPIREAARRLAALPTTTDRFHAQLAEPRTSLPAASLGKFFSPVTVIDALALKTRVAGATWIAGGTDLGVNLSRGQMVAPAFIALDRIAELQHLEIGNDVVRIGAGVSLTRIERELQGIFPALDQIVHWFAGRQVRNRATFGGNLGSASPIGDLLPFLLALDATVHLQGPAGIRDIPAGDFFVDYRKTVRSEDELVTSISLPKLALQLTAGYKVAKRQTDDISVVVAVFALQLDEQQRIARARLAFGGVAAVPMRAREVEEFLQGRVLDAETIGETRHRLEKAFTPISDHRASAEYRRALCGNLFARFVAEHCR